MSLCFKCNKSIKPLSLATTVKGEKYHPTCLFCGKCERALWGRPFKKINDGSLVCDGFCEPQIKSSPVISTIITSRPSSAQRQQQLLIEQTKNIEANNPQIDVEKYRKYNMNANTVQIKVCNTCNQSVENQRYITYENGEIICQYCEDQKKIISSSKLKHEDLFECVICSKLVKGSKFITEKNGDVICENCDINGIRCDKCNQLFKKNEIIRRLNFDIKYHDHCFNCKMCNKLVHTEEFILDENKKHPICSDCDKLSKLPKCRICNGLITGSFLNINRKPIHDKCFNCSNCGTNLLNDNYFIKDDSEHLLCNKCNLDLNGIKCAKCFQVIEKDGITFADKDYHNDCFKCQKCGINLATMKKTLTDKDGNSLYCEPCFVNQFAPRCNKCSEPIPPYLPGAVYEDKNFHKECFACARCKQTLVNKKFFKSGTILVCEKCF